MKKQTITDVQKKTGLSNHEILELNKEMAQVMIPEPLLEKPRNISISYN